MLTILVDTKYKFLEEVQFFLKGLSGRVTTTGLKHKTVNMKGLKSSVIAREITRHEV